jgi:hypothetical protein
VYVKVDDVLDTHDVHEEDWFELFCPTFCAHLN